MSDMQIPGAGDLPLPLRHGRLGPGQPVRKGGGCVGGLARLFLILVVMFLIFEGVTAAIVPWAFYLGGSFHVIPWWEGAGVARSAGGEYKVWIQLYPSGGIRNRLIGGNGVVCTPSGQRFAFKLRGGFLDQPGPGTDSNGKRLHFTLYQRLNMVGNNQNTRNEVSFEGAWQNPGMTVGDQGSISRNFNPDGTRFVGEWRKRPVTETLSFNLQPTSNFGLFFSCSR
jgi:hypothetical protein